jgi:hypothetical protein
LVLPPPELAAAGVLVAVPPDELALSVFPPPVLALPLLGAADEADEDEADEVEEALDSPPFLVEP